jgi:hypothetical protein
LTPDGRDEAKRYAHRHVSFGVEWWKAVTGAAIVLIAIREMFQDLFHPSRSGALSDWIGHALFRTLRRWWPRVLASAGPLTVVIVIFTWALLLVTGFAFIYWSVFPADFHLRTVNRPTGPDDFWWCFYYSLQMLTTLGLGDIEAVPNWLRILSALHTLIGFSLVTASITWVVLLFPALRRARTLARKAQTLALAEEKTGVPVAAPRMHVVLAGLAEEVIRTRVDLVHFPLLIYFYADESRASLADAVFPLKRFADEGMQGGRDELILLSATALHFALEDLAEKLGERLELRGEPSGRVFRAFAEFHLKPSESR